MYAILIGFTKDITGDYMTGFYFMGSSMIIGAILIHLEPIAKRSVERSVSLKEGNCKIQNSIDT